RTHIRPPPLSTLFPYTTLFRSAVEHRQQNGRPITCALRLRSIKRPAWGARALRDELQPDRLERPGREPAIRRGWTQGAVAASQADRKSTRLNSSHDQISYAVFC